MEQKIFDLPGTGYPQLEDVIKFYYLAGDYATIAYIKSISNIGSDNISRNHDFLIATGILEGTKNKKRLTTIGKKLGKSIQSSSIDETAQVWRKIIGKVDFFNTLRVSLIKFNPIQSYELKSKIFEISGKYNKPFTARALTSGKTIIDILKIAEYIKPEYRGKVKFYRIIPEAQNQKEKDVSEPILDLLHPNIIKSSYHHYLSGHYRDAVLNAFIAVFDLIRERTKLDLDGAPLAQTVFSVHIPKLVISTIHTESGRNEQVGFMKLLDGAFSSIRNPKAHSLSKRLNKLEAAQNLVFASLLARRIDQSKEPSNDKK